MEKYKLRDGRWALLNRETGEIVEADFTIKRKRRSSQFMKLWQDIGWETRLGKLQGNSLRMLWFLINRTAFCNIVPSPSLMAVECGWKQPHVSRAYRELREADFLCQRDRSYYLNPYFCWKGNDTQYQQACREQLRFALKSITEQARLLGKIETSRQGT